MAENNGACCRGKKGWDFIVRKYRKYFIVLPDYLLAVVVIVDVKPENECAVVASDINGYNTAANRISSYIISCSPSGIIHSTSFK